MSKIEEQSKGRKEGEIRYLTRLILIPIPKRNIVVSSVQVSNTWITKTPISY